MSSEKDYRTLTTDNRDLYPIVKSKDDNNGKNEFANRSENDISQLRGKTLQIYYYLAKNPRKHGVREIQRTFNYSSPSISAYHLNKLHEYKLISKTDDGLYYIDGDPIRLGELKDHVKFAGIFIPRILVYGIYVVSLILFAFILYGQKVNQEFWFYYVVTTNFIFLIFIIKDARYVSSILNNKNKI